MSGLIEWFKEAKLWQKIAAGVGAFFVVALILSPFTGGDDDDELVAEDAVEETTTTAGPATTASIRLLAPGGNTPMEPRAGSTASHQRANRSPAGPPRAVISPCTAVVPSDQTMTRPPSPEPVASAWMRDCASTVVVRAFRALPLPW